MQGKKIPWEQLQRSTQDVRRFKIGIKEISHFTKQLATLLRSGINLPQALLSIQEQTHNKKMKVVIQGIYDEVQEGNSLSYALSRYPNQFNELYLSLVTVGETSGALDKCLIDIGRFLDTQQKIQASIKNAMIYPSIVLGTVIILLVTGSYYFIPMFQDLFAQIDMDLPTITRAVFWLANHIKHLITACIIILVSIKFVFLKMTPIKRRYIVLRDALALKIPVIRDMVLNISMFYFSSALSLMLGNGIRIIDSLVMSSRVVPNKLIQAQIQDCKDLLGEGVNLSEALSQQPHFSSVVCSMVGIGEESGRLGDILQQTADYYGEQIKTQIEAMEQWIQPAAILLIAIIIVPVIIAIFIPILDLSSGKFLKQ